MWKKVFVTIAAAQFAASALLADSRSVYEAQVALNALGYAAGQADGAFGPQTEKAFASFCIDNGFNNDDSIDADDLVQLRYSAREEVKIPTINKHIFEVTAPLKAISDVEKFTYPACKDTILFSKMVRVATTEALPIVNAYDEFFRPDTFKSFPHWNEFDLVEEDTVKLSQILFHMHHLCLAGVKSACQEIIELSKIAAKRSANVQNFDTTKSARLTELHFVTVSRILTPLLLGYSTATQTLGIPVEHEAIGRWAYAALLQNTYNPYARPGQRTGDFFRDEDVGSLGACKDIRAQGHSLQSAYALSVYGVIWQDDYLFNLGFDSLEFTLASIREDGSLSCEAMRGSNAIFYSGSVLSNILQFLYLGELQGIDVSKIKNVSRVHSAAKFLIEAGLDSKKIEPYAKLNINAWCNKDYRRQCIDTPFGRIAGYGWIRLYKRLFPEAPLVQEIDALANEMASADGLDDERKINLGAILKSNYPTEYIAKNLIDDRSDLMENSTSVYEDVIEPNRGSPYCLYSVDIR